MTAYLRFTSADLNRVTTSLSGHGLLIQHHVKERRIKRGGRLTAQDYRDIKVAQGFLDLKDRLLAEWDAAQGPDPDETAARERVTAGTDRP